MRQTNIRVVVQDGSEVGSDFGHRLTKKCSEITEEFKADIADAPTVQMTSDQFGRQTATIQFFTTTSE